MGERINQKNNWSSTAPQQDSAFKLRSFSTKDNNDEELQQSPDINISKFSLPTTPPFPNANIQRQEQNQEEKEPEEKPEINLKSDAPPTEESEEENKSEEQDSLVNLKPVLPSTETSENEKENLEFNSIQTKLTIGKPGDKYEQEADATAAKVMAMSNKESEEIHRQSHTNVATKPKVLRYSSLSLQAKANKTSTSSSLENRLGSSKGGGSPLPDSVRGFMEPRFGADFSNVRVHTDSGAVQMNKELGAQAFAHGNDIYYGAGKSPGNNELTAHELTHTIQQTGGKLQPKVNKLRLKSNIGTSNKIKPFERLGSKEADSDSKFEPENELPSKEQTKDKQKLKSNQVKTSKKNKASTPEAVPGEQNQKTQELKSQTPETGNTEDVNSQKETQEKQEQTKDKAVETENPQNSRAQQPAAKPLQEQKGLDKEMKSNAAPVTKAQATPKSGSGGGGSQVAGGSGGDVGGEVNEEAEAKAMEQRMAEAETPEDSDSEQLSSLEKEVALTAIAEDPVPGEPANGGGGGDAIAEQPQPQAPDVSQSEPSAALAAISHLPPTKLLSAIGGVSGAVTTTVGKQKEALVANPPTLETPSGAKSPASEVAKSVPEDKPKAVEKKPDGEAKPVPQPQPLPPQKSSPQVKTPPPAVQGNEKGELSSSDVEKMQASISTMPVKDSGAMEISAGNPPELELTGNANPQKAQEQKAELEKSLAETQAKGQQSLTQPMGEDAIVHSVPQQTLKAQIAGGAGDSGGAAASGGGGETDMGDTISILAQQEKGGEIQAAAAKAQGEFATHKQEHSARVTEEKAQSHQYIEQLKLKNAEQQAQEKGKAKAQVQQMRGEWSKEQQTLVNESGTEANKLVNEGIKEIDTKKAEGEAEAQKEIHKGEQNAEQERKKGETEAAAERQKGERESSGLFGWLASKAKAFFDGIKQGIQKAFEAARAAMRQAIELAKSMAAKAIEKCRQAIVATIQRVGNALIAIGDKLLAQWPGLQKKWRDSIKKRVEQAEAAVNKLAQDLNQGIQKGLDLYGKGLDAALGLMEKGMLAAVSVYEGAVMGAIKFGEGAAKALGAFAVLAKDIGANPGQWIGNLGAAVSDGIKNHLWNAFQQQVQAWFNQKLEAVLGLGTAVWKILTQGGISMAEVGKMAWTGVKQALPMIIIGVLLERLVSMIVPAAGAVLAVIQGLQAAWGTVSQIIQAFGQFMTFLKAVKTGNAGPQFGAVLASSAIVLLEFITNFIIVKIAKAAQKVAGKLKGLAKNLMKRGKGKKNKKKDKEKSRDEKVQKRVEKVKRELPPKINRLLTKKPSKFRLKAQFSAWRLAYRLRQLKLQGKEGKLNIIAQVNPTIDLTDGWTFKATEVFKVLDKIAGEYITQAKTLSDNKSESEQESSSRISLDLASPATPTVTLASGNSYLVGKTQEGKPVDYKYGSGPFGWGAIKAIDSDAGRGSTYLELKSKLAGVEVGDIFTKILRNEPLPELPDEQRNAIGELLGIWFAKEPSHPRIKDPQNPGKYIHTHKHRRDLVYSLMVSQLMTPEIGQEHLNKHLNVSQAIDKHPAAFGGAQKGARQVTAEMLDENTPLPGKDTREGKSRDERYKREIETIKDWFKRHANDLPILNRQPTIKDVENFVREQLQKYVRGQ